MIYSAKEAPCLTAKATADLHQIGIADNAAAVIRPTGFQPRVSHRGNIYQWATARRSLTSLFRFRLSELSDARYSVTELITALGNYFLREIGSLAVYVKFQRVFHFSRSRPT